VRHASGLTQPALSALTGYSVTTIGHAETGRLWQSRDFWEKTDLTLTAGGKLTRPHDDWTYSARPRPCDALNQPEHTTGSEHARRGRHRPTRARLP
jgi:hypothetical protein